MPIRRRVTKRLGYSRRRRWKIRNAGAFAAISRNSAIYNGTFRWIIASDYLKISMTARGVIRIAQAKDALRAGCRAGRSLGDDATGDGAKERVAWRATVVSGLTTASMRRFAKGCIPADG